MKTFSYNKEILTATGEMIRLFSNITILNLHGPDGNKPKTKNSRKILVPLKFSQRSRILKNIQNPNASPVEYPLITLEKKGISADLQRNSEIHHDIANMSTLIGYDANTHPPIPINIEFSLSIFSKYPEDVDMIVSNFAPWFNTDVFITSPHPKLEGKKLHHQVIWNGEVNYDWKFSLQPTDQDVIVATTSFTFKTELFAGYGPIGDSADGTIYSVVLGFPQPYGGKTEGETDTVNNISGFFSVPYSQDFDEYSEQIISGTIDHSKIEYDGIRLDAFNEQFNSAVYENDIEKMKESAEKGADIYLHSYWPYAFASKMGFTEIVEWLESNGSLKPEFDGEKRDDKYIPHYPPEDEVKISVAELR